MTDEQTLEQIQAAKAEAEPTAEPAEMPTEEVPTTPTQPVEDFEKILAESQEIAETEYGFVKFSDTVKTGLISKEAVKAFSIDWGKKFLDNVVKATISFPYIVRINQEALKELNEKYKNAEEKDKKGIKESIYGTLGQIKTILAQIEALKGMNQTYENVLEELNGL